ncbi:hypothetical protein MPTK1_3g10810 [Marchantia polymorpha subsp. ruderalis]|uniref:Phytocyanin domain-containing protein n=2 Tax=Marchantia polymorpha TaxID=3197 RepID=A0A176VKA7_MARPO|nr:hypothetical protein AXG93_3658s1200 [Marchantia polymorpha subsp. ruderalis]PTQ40946.1 hypothetical protein MARPO_0037s0115 [Marchantia polymorpha]BBN05158.1 hypothetical protein Mp_3g10810 [Marchantia polymorpha subsp. ruderalis]|eukprot:PTQ40946.1 hypothetical protein MARPO_0037s0115 [Marchantia polymorpha]
MALERSTMLALLLISLGLLQTALAAEYVVGDATGWTYDETLKFYNDWAASKTLKVGDSLKFNWVSVHDVVEMSQADADACNSVGNKISEWQESGAVVDLTTAGTHSYICSIGSHCNAGMKMTVTVLAADTSTPASPPPPATPGVTAAPPPPPTAASSIQLRQPLIVGALALIAACAALSF